MKKYLCVASLFLWNNEILSWFALLVLAAMGIVAFLKAAEEGGLFK